MARPALRRAGVGLVWYVVPAIAVAAVAAYVIGAVVWHANPPAVPVAGVSMKPTLEPGDLVFLKGVDPKSLRVGEIIAVHVPKDSQSQYSLPGELVHRIVKIQQTPLGPIFHTKGDANSGPDVFVTHSGDIVGRLVGRAPGLGYPLLFFRSNQGKIFLGAALLVALIYFLIGFYEERRLAVQGTAIGLQSILAETQELKAVLETARHESPSSLPTWGHEAPQAPGEIGADVRRIREGAEQTTETVRQLVGAIGEYGTHLRSHTAVMQNLAATTAELHRATAELSSTVAEPTSPRQATTSVELLPRAETSIKLAGRPPVRVPELPLAVPTDLLQQRVLLEARTTRVDALLHRLSVGPGDGTSANSSG